MNTLILKFIKFCAVGASGLAIDFGFTYLFKDKWHYNKYIANSIGFVLAASSNYVLNRYWTFNSQNANIGLEYLDFIFVSIIGLGINNLALWFIHSKSGFPFYGSKIGAIGVATFWNFAANYLYTFNQLAS